MQYKSIEWRVRGKHNLDWWRKVFWQNPTIFHDENTQRNLGVEEKFSNITKGIYKKTIANIIFIDELLKSLPEDEKQHEDVYFHNYYAALYWKFYSQHWGNKTYANQKGRSEPSLFTDDPMYRKSQRIHTQKRALQLINQFNKF